MSKHRIWVAGALCLIVLLGIVPPQVGGASPPAGSGEPRRERLPGSRPPVEAPAPEPTYKSDEILVCYRPGAGGPARDRVTSLAQGRGRRPVFGAPDLEVVSLAPEVTVEAALQQLNSSPELAWAQPNYVYHPASDDPYYGLQWGLDNPYSGYAGVDIDIPAAWTMTHGSPAVIVAVVDSGVDASHPDLSASIWSNPLDPPDGTDNDGNGLVDDTNGWDFYNSDKTVFHSYSEDHHGTHVAGTIAAAVGNAVGVAGIAPYVRVMPLKFLGQYGGTTDDAISAINYARLHGAKVINASWAGGSYDAALYSAISQFNDAGGLFVAAAGNNGLNNDVYGTFPANFNLAGIVSTASIDYNGALSSFSNYGAVNVDLGAPGGGIWSTFPPAPQMVEPAAVTAIGSSFAYKAVLWGFGAEDFADSTTRNDAVRRAMSFLGVASGGHVLLVDDDESASGWSWCIDVRSAYQSALTSLGYYATVWDVASGGNGPTADDMFPYDAVVWFTGHTFGSSTTYPLTSTDQGELDTYLMSSGRLLLAGRDAVFGNEGSVLVTDYLHIGTVGEWGQQGPEPPHNGLYGLGGVYAGVSYDHKWHGDEYYDYYWINDASRATGVLSYCAGEYAEAYASISGTSMAAPHVSGVAALVLSINPTLSRDALKTALLSTTTPLSSLSGRTVTGGLVNAPRAVASVPCLKGITLSPNSFSLAEGGSPSTFTVVLGTMPAGTVTLTAAANDQVQLSPSTVGFTLANWNTPRTVSITARDDLYLEDDVHSTDVAYTASGGDYDLVTVPSVHVEIQDNDEPGLTIVETGGATAVTEGSTAGDTYTVALSRRPTGPVTLTLTSTSEVTVTPASISFSTTDWASARTVTVLAVDNLVIEGPRSGSVAHTASGGGYDGASLPGVSVAVADNDTLGAPLTPAGVTSPDGVILGWQPPTGVVPGGYEVHIATVSTGPFTKVKDVTTWEGAQPNTEVTATDFASTGFTFSGGSTYYFKLRSYVDVNPSTRVTSAFTAAVSAKAGPIPPLAPTGVAASTSPNGIRLGWTAPTSGVAPQGYDIYMASASAGPWTLIKAVTSWDGASPNCEVTQLDLTAPANLTAGQTYYFQVRSYIVHSVAGKFASGPSTAAYAKAGPPVPGTPAYFTATTTASGPATGIHLAWKPPVSGPAPVGYSVWTNSTSTGTFTFVKDVTSWSGTSPNCDITVLDFNGEGLPVFDLKGGVTYYFRVYSYVIHPVTAAKVTCATAAAAYAIAGPPAPGAPTYATATTAPLGVALSWKPPLSGPAPAGYSVWINTATTGTYTFVKDVTAWEGTYPNVTITAADLDGTDLGGGVVEPVFAFNGGVRYYFRIYSYTVHPLDGSRVVSTTAAAPSAVAGPLPPNPPTSPVGATTANGFTLRWTAPISGTVPTGYRIELSLSSTAGFVLLPDVTAWEGASPNAPVTGAAISSAGLTYTPGKAYYARIHSFVPHPVSGEPLVSVTYASAAVVAGPIPPGAPTYPTVSTVPAASGGGMNLTWRAPTLGTVPSGYQVYASASSTSGFVQVKDVTSWTGTYPNSRVVAVDFSVAGLTMKSGVRYYFRIYSYTLHPSTGVPVLSLGYASVSGLAG